MRLPLMIAAISSLLAAPALAVQTDAPKPSVLTGASAETVARGLSRPWGLTFLPGGNMLVTEKPGRIRLVTREGKVSEALVGAPNALSTGQGGMLDIAAAPDFETTREVYVCFTEARRGGATTTSLSRLKLVGDTLGTARLEGGRVIFRQGPSYRSGYHFGCRIAFPPDGTVFVTLGERGQRDPAQDLKTHVGKVVRLNRDGSVPSDNPFVGKSGALPEIWSSGHRNPQAAAINPTTGKLWLVEHGARGGDEINIPEAGKNYGWPVISYGTHYSGAKIGVGRKRAGMEQPAYYWDPSIAPSGMAFYTSDRFPQWKGNLFVGALKFRQLHRLVLDGDKVVAEETLISGLQQRIRAVRQGPDGALYVLTDSTNGRVIRVTPRR